MPSNLKVGDKIRLIKAETTEQAEKIDEASNGQVGCAYSMLVFFGKEHIISEVNGSGTFKIKGDSDGWNFSPNWIDIKKPTKVTIGELV